MQGSSYEQNELVAGARLFRLTPREEALNLDEQALWKQTLGDEAVGAVAPALVGERKPMELGKDDHAQVRAGEADLLCSLQPVDPRHAEIEKDKVRLPERGEMHRVLAVTGRANDLKTTRELEIVAD